VVSLVELGVVCFLCFLVCFFVVVVVVVVVEVVPLVCEPALWSLWGRLLAEEPLVPD
jgi:hypothetical protein